MSAGATKNKSGTRGKRLGVKKFGGEEVYPNDILIRQNGLKFHPGKNTSLSKNNNIVATCEVGVSSSLHLGSGVLREIRKSLFQEKEEVCCPCDPSVP